MSILITGGLISAVAAITVAVANIWSSRGQTRADTADTLTDTAMKLLDKQTERISILEHRLSEIESVNRDLRDRMRSMEENFNAQHRALFRGIDRLIAQLSRLGETPEWTPYNGVKENENDFGTD